MIESFRLVFSVVGCEDGLHGGASLFTAWFSLAPAWWLGYRPCILILGLAHFSFLSPKKLGIPSCLN
ncbi:hypothetical protein NC651_037661 [Populus alba x Populus x berolinensis]|nr:hypothetical protein NC651_037661 [Populus alba x Populus x berolinensis]